MATGRACTGYEDTGECRTVADCPESVSGRRTYCAHAQTGDSRCGNPFFEPQCPMDGCGEGMVCVAFGVCGGTQCQPECTDATCSGTSYCVDRVCEPKPCDIDGANPCPNDHECDPEASNNPNGCVPLSCSGDPALCHPWQECEPNTAGANLFGCLTKSCTADEGCGDCGYCVNQNCSPTLANCYEELPAMPYGCVWPEEELV